MEDEFSRLAFTFREIRIVNLAKAGLTNKEI